MKDGEVVSVKEYSIRIEEKWSNEKKRPMHNVTRKNRGFSAIELLGVLENAQLDILEQMSGTIRPDVVKRTVEIPEAK
jgi:hypothetical protein